MKCITRISTEWDIHVMLPEFWSTWSNEMKSSRPCEQFFWHQIVSCFVSWSFDTGLFHLQIVSRMSCYSYIYSLIKGKICFESHSPVSCTEWLCSGWFKLGYCVFCSWQDTFTSVSSLKAGSSHISLQPFAVDVGYERFLGPEIFFHPEVRKLT